MLKCHNFLNKPKDTVLCLRIEKCINSKDNGQSDVRYTIENYNISASKWQENWLCYDVSKYELWSITGIDIIVFFYKKGPSPASFSFICGLFQTNNTIFTTNQCIKNVMSIQYLVPGFEPTTFGMWVSSHNHKTRTRIVCDDDYLRYTETVSFCTSITATSGERKVKLKMLLTRLLLLGEEKFLKTPEGRFFSK